MLKFGTLGKQFLAEREGRKNKQYPDTEGSPTIGVGHKLLPSELKSGKVEIIDPIAQTRTFVPYKTGLTNAQVDALLISDLITVEATVSRAIYVPLTQFQYDALVSFCFNIGNDGFAKSTLVKRINAHRFDDVPYEMRRWIHDDKGNHVKGLENRREFEIDLWNGEWSPKANG